MSSTGLIKMSLSRNGPDWKQKKLLVNGEKFNTKMKIEIKKYLWKSEEP